jgi:hypothetical protein
LPAPTFNEQMVTKLEAALLANPGAQSITVDGTTSTYVDLVERLKHFKAEVAREAGTRPRFSTVNLGGFR